MNIIIKIFNFESYYEIIVVNFMFFINILFEIKGRVIFFITFYVNARIIIIINI